MQLLATDGADTSCDRSRRHAFTNSFQIIRQEQPIDSELRQTRERHLITSFSDKNWICAKESGWDSIYQRTSIDYLRNHD